MGYCNKCGKVVKGNYKLCFECNQKKTTKRMPNKASSNDKGIEIDFDKIGKGVSSFAKGVGGLFKKEKDNNLFSKVESYDDYEIDIQQLLVKAGISVESTIGYKVLNDNTLLVRIKRKD